MAAPDYRVVSFNLATARDRATIVETGTRIIAVMVQAAPAAASLHFGANRDPVPALTGDSWDTTAEDENGCPVPLDEGLFLTNAAAAGLLTLVVSFGSAGAGLVKAAA